MEKTKKIVYFSPNIYEELGDDWSIDYVEKMSDSELITFAKNLNEATVYSLEGFAYAFNAEQISDMGYIFIVEG